MPMAWVVLTVKSRYRGRNIKNGKIRSIFTSIAFYLH